MARESGNSWGHTLRLMTDAEQARIARNEWQCAIRRCTRPVTHAAGYRYVTGARGRVSDAERKLCTDHAGTFATKYGVAMPEAAHERAPGALDVALQDFLPITRPDAPGQG